MQKRIFFVKLPMLPIEKTLFFILIKKQNVFLGCRLWECLEVLQVDPVPQDPRISVKGMSEKNQIRMIEEMDHIAETDAMISTVKKELHAAAAEAEM